MKLTVKKFGRGLHVYLTKRLFKEGQVVEVITPEEGEERIKKIVRDVIEREYK